MLICCFFLIFGGRLFCFLVLENMTETPLTNWYTKLLISIWTKQFVSNYLVLRVKSTQEQPSIIVIQNKMSYFMVLNAKYLFIFFR